ncbi:MAG: TonB-dependent receptor [Sterolibacteriaceae bacterium]|nr:TonB-dependent receptor [Sterolibacteriaceae bacterium]
MKRNPISVTVNHAAIACRRGLHQGKYPSHPRKFDDEYAMPSRQPIVGMAKPPRSGLFRLQVVAAVLSVFLAGGHAAARSLSDDEASRLSLEDLLAVEVYSTEHYVRQLSGAASSASVVTAAEIRAYGYRNLADILKSMPGLYVTNDRNYSYLGSRGFGNVGDWNSRVLFLVDGNRVNENIYDSAYIANDFIVDVGLIDRVEYVAGPAAAMLYGNNAFFGVVNVTTRSGHQLDGGEAAATIGSGAARKARFSYGKRLDSGLDVLLSGSRLKIDGTDQFVPELNDTSRKLDHERADHLFAKFSYGDFVLEMARSERTKGIPNASYQQVFNDPRSGTVDEQQFVTLKYNRTLEKDSALSGRLYMGSYDFAGSTVYDRAAVAPPDIAVYLDSARGRWWGGEIKFVSSGANGHKLLLGADYQNNPSKRQRAGYLDQAPDLDDRRKDASWGLYAHDQVSLGQSLELDIGGRYDRAADGTAHFHPRLGLIRQLLPDTVGKLLYGEAFRPPNVYENFYDVGDRYQPNPALSPETIKTAELVLEHRPDAGSLISATLFRNEMRKLIDYAQTADPDGVPDSGDEIFRFENLRNLTTSGAELRFDRQLQNGGSFRISYTRQRTRDHSGGRIQNSPRDLAKLNWIQPLRDIGLRAGIEMQYVGSRVNFSGDPIGQHLLTNLTLSRNDFRVFDLSLTVANLFNRKLADPAAFFHDPVRRIPLDGRTWHLQATYRF